MPALIRDFLIFLLLAVQANAYAAPELVPAAPKIAADAYLLMDFHSGRIIAEKNIDKRVEPASLTKLMASYAIMYELKNGSIGLDDKVRVSEKAWRMKGSRMFIEAGKFVSVRELMLGMIVQSGNDATVALAEHTAGSEDSFVSLMNRHAENLGMLKTHFVNSTGWPHPDHTTNARDLALLTKAMIRDFPGHYALYKIKQYTYNDIKQYNRNLLLWQDNRVDGVKTGHTESAGYCLISSGEQRGMRLISVVLGTKSEQARARASRKLLNYGFRFYETYRLHSAEEPLSNIRIYKGEEKELALGLKHDLYVTTPRGVRERVVADIQIDETVIAPVRRGQRFGNVEIKLGETLIATRPLIALQDIETGGFWRRMIDNVSLWFN